MARRGVNKVILVGNLGRDPEVRYMPSGGAVAAFSLATSDSWKDKDTGLMQERTEWHRISMFNRLAEIAGEYLRKGAKVYIEGSLRTRKWVDQQGVERYTTEIIATEMQMLDSKGGASGDYPPQPPLMDDQSYPSQPYPSAQKPASASGVPSSASPAEGAYEQYDDEIPF